MYQAPLALRGRLPPRRMQGEKAERRRRKEGEVEERKNTKPTYKKTKKLVRKTVYYRRSLICESSWVKSERDERAQPGYLHHEHQLNREKKMC